LSANALFYELSYQCPNECVRKEEVIWNISLINVGEEDVDIAQLMIVEIKDDGIVAETMESELTTDDLEIIGSNKTTVTRIKRDESANFTIEGTLPNPNYNNSLVYHFCHLIRNKLEHWQKVGPTNFFCYPENHTIEIVDCTSNYDCKIDAYCSNKSCITLDCNECQYLGEHECIDYGCCSDEDCALNEACIDHNCTILNCTDVTKVVEINDKIDEDEDQVKENDKDILEDKGVIEEEDITKAYLVNHSCSFEPCAEDEIIRNYMCREADCRYDEFIANYVCKELNCSWDEGYVNNSCQKLNCSLGEGIKDHECRPLECDYDEYLFNYSCKELYCRFFQKAEEHECRINSNLVVYILLLIIIGILGFIDFKVYDSGYRKKMVRFWMKKLKDDKNEGKDERDPKIKEWKETEAKKKKESKDKKEGAEEGNGEKDENKAESKKEKEKVEDKKEEKPEDTKK